MTSPILFILLAAIAIVGAVGTVVSRNAIYSALYLILNMCALAVLYLVLNAPFLAMVQITVYAGAIMVLFLFVIMLLGADQLAGLASNLRQKIVPLALGLILMIMLAIVGLRAGNVIADAAPLVPAGPAEVGMAFFQTYVFPFEVTSVLLLVAMIGVIVLQSKKRG